MRKEPKQLRRNESYKVKKSNLLLPFAIVLGDNILIIGIPANDEGPVDNAP